jgi:hypothetical protein
LLMAKPLGLRGANVDSLPHRRPLRQRIHPADCRQTI